MQKETGTSNRRSIRLKGDDYTQAGGYFVTICTHLRECLFGEVSEGKVILNAFGKVVQEEWEKTKQMRQGINLDAFIVMPNHIHGILILEGPPYSAGRRGTMHRAPTFPMEGISFFPRCWYSLGPNIYFPLALN